MLQNNGFGVEGGPSGPVQHVAVLDADTRLRALLCRSLRANGYECTGLESREQLDEIMRERAIDLIVLDATPSSESGYEICRAIRETSRVPIVMTGARSEERDRVKGLDLGADDYVAKPFGRAEVVARVRAVLRRAAMHRPADAPPVERFAFAGWAYRPRLHQLIAPSGAEVELTAAEHELLLTLLRHPQRTIGRERLLEMTRARVRHASERSIDMLISRLRRKMDEGAGARPLIRTIRGGGYMLAAEVASG